MVHRYEGDNSTVPWESLPLNRRRRLIKRVRSSSRRLGKSSAANIEPLAPSWPQTQPYLQQKTVRTGWLHTKESLISEIKNVEKYSLEVTNSITLNIIAYIGNKKSQTGSLLEIKNTRNTVSNQMPNLQIIITDRIKSICEEFRISTQMAARASRVLLGEEYVSPVSLPEIAPARWKCRGGEDQNLSPLQFMHKYWGIYLENDVLFQADLKLMDDSLFEAIKSYCRNHGLSLKDNLPPPSRTKKRQRKSPASVDP